MGTGPRRAARGRGRGPRRAGAGPGAAGSPRRGEPARGAGVVLFDGVCNMCSSGVDFMVRWEAARVGGEPGLRFAALQSEPGRELLRECGRSPDDISSIVLVAGPGGGRAAGLGGPEQSAGFWVKSEAILRIAQECRAPLPWLAAFLHLLPLWFRDSVYDFVANNRYSVFGRRDSCRLGAGALGSNLSERFLE